ncbi:hypothetical protein AcV5_007155 [Taiwanofungus camphoratus]|nr:hypothetical protein AcV5_007155 [Antrodia cinnamomea]
MVKSLLTKTAGLLSLNLQYAIDDNPEPLLSHDLCASVSFLPRLTAVNTNDNRLISTQGLASGRPLQYIRIQGFTSEKLYAQLKEPLHLSMKSILHLQLAFDVVSLDAAVQLLEVMVRDFQAVTHLGVQFRLPKPRLVTWEMYEDALDKMGPLIARLSSLKAFSLVTSPDPILSIAHEGRRHQLDSDRYEEETMKTARRFLNKHGLCLQRLELRWHGWKIDRAGSMRILTLHQETDHGFVASSCRDTSSAMLIHWFAVSSLFNILLYICLGSICSGRLYTDTSVSHLQPGKSEPF